MKMNKMKNKIKQKTQFIKLKKLKNKTEVTIKTKPKLESTKETLLLDP